MALATRRGREGGRRKMGDTGQVKVRVHSAGDLLAVAEGLEKEAAARYRSLAARMTLQGDHEMAAQFKGLAAMEDAHGRQIAEHSMATLGHKPDLSRVKWEAPRGFDEEEARGAELSAYKALAFAVRNEERAFAFYSYVAAEAENDAVRALAETLARDELHHASLLRQYRRRAFHQKRPATFQIPQTLDDLHAMARQWDAEAAAAHRALAGALHIAGEHHDAAIFNRLADAEAQSAGDVAADSAPTLGTAAEGLRLLEEGFDRYAAIADRAGDESIVAEAQRLAGQMVSRLASTGGARGNALLEGGGGR